MTYPYCSSSLGLRVKETKEVYEGEVTELTPAETENPLSGYGKTISHVVVALKTVKGTKQLRLDPSIYESIQKERVSIGDVIYIEANTGAVKVSLLFSRIVNCKLQIRIYIRKRLIAVFNSTACWSIRCICY